MSWGDTLILVISRGVQLYYGIAQPETSHAAIRLTLPMGGGGGMGELGRGGGGLGGAGEGIVDIM